MLEIFQLPRRSVTARCNLEPEFVVHAQTVGQSHYCGQGPYLARLARKADSDFWQIRRAGRSCGALDGLITLFTGYYDETTFNHS